MKSSDAKKVLAAIRQAYHDQTYVLTPHAVLEMQSDRFNVIDVESAILTGTIKQMFDDDPRGRRYEVVGKACDLTTDIAVVVRFAGPLLIITIYEIKS